MPYHFVYFFCITFDTLGIFGNFLFTTMLIEIQKLIFLIRFWKYRTFPAVFSIRKSRIKYDTNDFRRLRHRRCVFVLQVLIPDYITSPLHQYLLMKPSAWVYWSADGQHCWVATLVSWWVQEFVHLQKDVSPAMTTSDQLKSFFWAEYTSILCSGLLNLETVSFLLLWTHYLWVWIAGHSEWDITSVVIVWHLYCCTNNASFQNRVRLM